MFYTYVIKRKKDGKWYTGYTKDLRKRLQEHSDNKVFATKGRGPFELIYYEACGNGEDARMREKYLKSGMGKRYLNNRLKRSLSLQGPAPLEIGRRRCPTASSGSLSLTGFTLLETVIVLAIMAMFFAISVPFFLNFTENAKFDASARSITSVLRTARTYAITNNAPYYVFFVTISGQPSYYISTEYTLTILKPSEPKFLVDKIYKLPAGISFAGENPSVGCVVFGATGRARLDPPSPSVITNGVVQGKINVVNYATGRVEIVVTNVD